MKEIIRDFAIAIAVVVLITIFIKPTIVKESSMEPTLYENNYLFVNKMAYVAKDHPDYGDIIVFKSDLDGKNLLIKRVVAVEGDTISVEDGKVIRNGEELSEPYTMDGYTEGDVEEETIPEDKMFVLGDNREVSLDSRYDEVGLVDEADIVGKAVVRILPVSDFGGLYHDIK